MKPPITLVDDQSTVPFKDPWATFDYAVELARDFFAVVGICAVVMFVVGYLWWGPK